MVFSSLFFLTVFLPATLLGCWGVRLLLELISKRRVKAAGLVCDGEQCNPSWLPVNAFLFGVSLLFYFWGEGAGVLWLIASVVVNHLLAVLIDRKHSNVALCRFFIFVAVAANLLFLSWFKYAGFGARIINSFLGDLIPVPEIALPLGISFYTFQAMSYVIDVYRGTVRPSRSIIDFGCYVTMFPQLVAGPIVRYSDIAEKLLSRSITFDDLSYGFRRFLCGLAKKVLIANSVAQMADSVWQFAEAGQGMLPMMAWLGVICYTIQIYYDFSGYSDMAIGMGRMLGFKFNENFLYPYCASSIRDFWRRWHISLSSWFRDYLYIPLGGSRKGKLRTGVNCLIVFGLCGLWHGAGIMFLLWGLWHGAFLMIERWLPEFKRPSGKLTLAVAFLVKHIYTICVFVFGWILFRSETFGGMAVILKSMFGLMPVTPETNVLWIDCSYKLLISMFIGILCAYPIVPYIRTKLYKNFNESVLYAIEWLWLTVLGLFAMLFVAGGSYNPFLYFRF